MTRWAKALTIVALALALTGASTAYVQQSGNITFGHLAYWVTQGVIGDAGTSANGLINTLGITANGGTPFCLNSAQPPAARVQLCESVNTSGTGGFTLNSYNGATAPIFTITINGTVYTFPFSGPSSLYGAFRTVASGTTDTTTQLDATVAWNSSSASGKSETLIACSGLTKGYIVIVKDEYGSAGTYPITVAGSGSDTIDGAATYIMAFNHQSTQFQCNGSGNWLVE